MKLMVVEAGRCVFKLTTPWFKVPLKYNWLNTIFRQKGLFKQIKASEVIW